MRKENRNDEDQHNDDLYDDRENVHVQIHGHVFCYEKKKSCV